LIIELGVGLLAVFYVLDDVRSIGLAADCPGIVGAFFSKFKKLVDVEVLLELT
jgi:hypothetical protein